MKMKPHALRTGNQNWSDAADSLRADSWSVSGHRGDVFAKTVTAAGPQAAQAPLDGPVFAPEPGPQFLPFAAGNIVVYRVGDGVGALGSGATAVFLDEYTTAGTFVQTIAMPTTDSGLHQMLTAAGSSTSEGLLTLSADGQYLILTGYDASVGTLAVAGTTAATVQRVIGRVGADGTVDTTTTLGTTAFNTGNIRGATSTDGTTLWAAGSNTGVVTTTLGSTTSTVIASSTTNLRGIDIYDGQLYFSSMSGALRVGTVGTGTPTTAGQPLNNLPGFPTTGSTNSPYQFFFADLTAAVAGVDTLYVADDRTIANGGGLFKFSLVSGNWTLNGTAAGGLTTGLRGLAGDQNGTTVSFYATTTQSNANQIFSLTDTGGYNAAFSSSTLTLVATAAANTAFRGIAFAPTPAAGGETQTVVFNPTSVTHDEGNSGTTAYVFTVTRTGGTTGQLDFSGTIAAGGTDNADYVGGTAPTVFNGSILAGQTSATVTINIQGDFTIEGLESFTLTLTSVTNAAPGVTEVIGANLTATGNITNDDSAGAISVADVSLAEGNAGTTVGSFTVARAGGATGTVTVDYAITLPGGVGGADGADVNDPLSGQVTFLEGETTASISFNINGDVTFEPDETFTVTISNPQGGATLGDATATATITNDDAAPAGTLSINDVSLAEGNSGPTAFAFTVTRAGGSAGAVGATWTLSAPGGAGNADAGDFAGAQLFTGTVSFADGDTSETITINVEGDTVFEANEAFTVTLSNPTGGAAIGDGTGAGVIQNDDVAPPVISIGDASLVEGDDGVTYLVFTVSLAAPSLATVTVDFDTSGASATEDSDYLGLSGQVSFAPGQTARTISVPLIGDEAPENNETFLVTLSNPSGAGAVIGDGSATGTITNDDGAAYYNLAAGSFTQNWTSTGLITADDNWGGVPFIIGYRGDDLTTATGTDARTITTTSSVIDVNANQSNPDTFVTGGVAEFHIANPAVGLNGSGTADAPYLALYMDATGRSAIRVQANLRDLDASADDAAQQIAVQYRTSPTGPWLNAPGGYFADVTTAGSATQVTAVDITLPADANGAATLEIRFLTTNSAGNDEWVGIDDIVVSSAQSGPSLSIANAAVFEGDAGPTIITFTVTRAGSSTGAVTADYAVSFGSGPFDASADDFTALSPLSGQVVFGDGETTAEITVSVDGDVGPEGDEDFTVTLSNPSAGATITDAVATGTIVNDDGPPPLVTINDVTVTEGDSGTSLMTFTVTRTGGTGAFDVDWETADGSATAGSDYVAASGTVHFADGQMTDTVTIAITVNGDTDPELGETLQILLSNATNFALITDPVGIGTIAGDDPIYIHDIQGTSYFSPILAGEGISGFNIASAGSVIVRAVVTAVDNDGPRQGYYLAEEVTDWDGNSFTSEGIFVMTRNDAGVGAVVAGVSVGDLVQVSAQVMEYQAFSTMPRTMLVNPTGLQLLSTGNALPTLTLTSMPNEVMTGVTPDFTDFADGVGDTFDASVYALSYFETVEGMLVTIPNMVVADGFVSTSGGDPFFQAYSLDSANADQLNSRGGYTIAGDPPVGPPDSAGTGDDTVQGGRHLHDGDVNPDIIELDFTGFAMSPPPGLATTATMGDMLGDVTGIIDFDFTDRKLFVTAMEPGGFVNGGIPAVETTALGNDSRALTVATFNVENLDPGDGAARFTALANAIANNLNAPDIISIEEMQDNNGATASGGADASTTWQMLVNALNLATGANYQWVDQEPNAGTEGGEPGGNIRVGFLYNTDRVQLGDLAANATLAERRMYTDRIGDGVRDAGDLIAFSDNMLGTEIVTADWAGTRRSLLGEFTFNGNVVYVTANHFPAKGGSGEFWQFNQDLETGDPDNSGWAQRNRVGEDVYSMMNLIQSGDPDAGIVAGGDFNDFYFYRPLTTVTGYTMADGTARVGGARFDNLTLTLAEAERYTYTFDGRSQAIDHIIANSLLSGVAGYDVVHLNTGYNASGTGPDASPRLSDHDPALSSFDFRNFSEILTGTGAADSINGFGGNDTISTLGGDDFLDGGAGVDSMAGGQGDDTYFVDDAAETVDEQAGEGRDVVYAAVSYALAAGTAVEILSADPLTGTAAINLAGNGLGNVLVGNAGANVLNGGGGADYMIGLGGDDTYFVDSAGDVAAENAGGGRDVVYADVSYALAAGSSIEVLSASWLGGTDPINLTGNELANLILGNAGANVLNGGGGADYMVGLGGDDTYFVDTMGDVVVEEAGGGQDVVYAGAHYTLRSGSSVEVLSAVSLVATTAINLTGNELGNVVVGNAGANVLNGGGGADYLLGLGGADTFAFTTALGGGNIDTIAEYSGIGTDGDDVIHLDDAVFAGLALGALDPSAFAIGNAALDAGDRIIYDSNTGALYFDADGVGGAAAVQFAHLDAAPALTAGDFFVI